MSNGSFNQEEFERYKQDPTFLGLIQSVEEQDDRFKELPEDDKYMAMYLLVSNQADAIDGFSEVVYKRPIPTPEEFLTKRYIGQFADLIYPKWKEVFLEAFSENARTKELVLTGCIGAGKSTMAMLCHFYNLYRINSLRYPQLVMGCFSADTKVLLPDMSSKTFKELVDSNVKELDILSYNKLNSKFIITKAINPRVTKSVNKILELTFEDNYKVRCTEDHKFLTHNRGWIRADELNFEDDVVNLEVK